ncbi:MAG: Ada metal-binding domain-containing protein [Kiritimatiellaceae bacterium]|nr:Ada metal-binding domain-containing protein [Kiritimatiellaceae bacterium]
MKKLAIITAAVLSAAFVSIAADAGVETTYKGNPDSKTFHKSSCRFFSNTNCTATFSAPEAALKAGYNACKVCKP